jgi:ribonuclease VapC
MSAFIDASVIVAILSREPDHPNQLERVEAAGDGIFFFSSVAVFEAAVALARKKTPRGARPTKQLIDEARSAVMGFLRSIGAEEIAISGEIADIALDASARFGKVVGHPASLNMGDCFAYACASSRAVPLLFKGDDFSQTDIPTA